MRKLTAQTGCGGPCDPRGLIPLPRKTEEADDAPVGAGSVKHRRRFSLETMADTAQHVGEKSIPFSPLYQYVQI